MEKLLDEIESYWNTRTEGYSEVNHKELAGTQKNAWLKVLTSQFPDKPKEEIRILDIGTGPGFFAILLAEAGYQVTAVDYTEEMLKEYAEMEDEDERNRKDDEDKLLDELAAQGMHKNLSFFAFTATPKVSDISDISSVIVTIPFSSSKVPSPIKLTYSSLSLITITEQKVPSSLSP